MLIRPFAAIRPNTKVAAQVAALPYDVYGRAEAREAVAGRPLSFLNIDRPETAFPPDADMYAEEVYAHARRAFDERIVDGTFVQDETPCFYLYELTMDGRTQTGFAACCSIDDYESGVIKKHENTLAAKEADRIRHIDALDAQTGPIFLAYRGRPEINILVDTMRTTTPLYAFTSEDGVTHRVWRMAEPMLLERFADEFSQVECAYIADGHHRAASAVKVGQARRAENPGYDGTEEFNFFMSVLFPAEQLEILPYNRIVRDLGGLTAEQFLAALDESFEILHSQAGPLEPIDKGAVGMYLDGRWYGLGAREDVLSDDPVAGLDVSILQDRVLGPILGIADPRADSRIEFVGGIRGASELQSRVDAYSADAGEEGPAVAFAMFPTEIGELLAVADAGLLMPPKSTWFEPKLRSGLFAHRIV